MLLSTVSAETWTVPVIEPFFPESPAGGSVRRRIYNVERGGTDVGGGHTALSASVKKLEKSSHKV